MYLLSMATAKTNKREGYKMSEGQKYLETLYLVKDPQEVWGTYCRECATKKGESFGLVWNTYPFMPESMHTPNGVSRPEGEEVEPLVFAPEVWESDIPLGCEDCNLWLEIDLNANAIEYIEDPFNEFTESDKALLLGTN